MNWKRRVCLPPNIKKKDEGQIVWVSGIFYVLILAIVMYSQLQLAAWQAAAVYIEDALAASNLASALIDLEEYGRTHKVLISDEWRAYAIYREALQCNLQLDENRQCKDSALFVGPMEIADYIIYNVDGNVVETIHVDSTGQVALREMGVKGTVVSPEGTVVEQTGVYSEIEFTVKGPWGLEIEAEKGKLVDIVPQEGEVNEQG